MRKSAIGLALLVASAASPALAQTSSWQVSEVSGDVRAMVNGQARPVSRGMLLASGSTVASGAGARAVLVSGRDYVILSPASRVRLPGGLQRASGSSPVDQMTQIVSEAGTALYRIERRPNPHFRVQTPYLAAVVKGTVFSVTVSSTGASVQVTEGAVEVSTVDGGAAELVRPGMVATVEAGDLRALNIQGETSRSIRSNGTPLPGVATVPVADAGRYDGPAETLAEISAPVREDPVSLADATDGLITGQAGVDLALSDVRDGLHPGRGNGGTDNSGASGNNGGAGGNGGNDNSGPGNNNGGGNGGPGGNGGGNDNSGPGNNNGGGNGGTGNGGPGGNGPGNDNSGPGNNNGGGNGGTGNGGPGGNGGGNDNSGPGNNNGGGNDDDAEDGGNGGGHGGGNRGNGGGSGVNLCLPADLACVRVGGGPRHYYSLNVLFDLEADTVRARR